MKKYKQVWIPLCIAPSLHPTDFAKLLFWKTVQHCFWKIREEGHKYHFRPSRVALMDIWRGRKLRRGAGKLQPGSRVWRRLWLRCYCFQGCPATRLVPACRVSLGLGSISEIIRWHAWKSVVQLESGWSLVAANSFIRLLWDSDSD